MMTPNKYPKTGTCSARLYYFADLEVVNFLNWVAYMAGSIDYMKKIAANALALGKVEPSNISDRIEDKGMIDQLKQNRRILIQMLHARMVDNYLSYLTHVLHESFCCKPEILRSSEKIEFAEVLAFQEMKDLVQHLAEKKILSLSYRSVGDLNEYFMDRFNATLLPEEKLSELIKAVETRNLVVHNRGIRNRLYCNKVGEDESMIGKLRDIGIDYVRQVNSMLFASVKELDSGLRKKLGLRAIRFNVSREFKQKA
jgi:hypothetical protein